MTTRLAAASAVGDPRALEREEGAGEQQVGAREGQAEGEPEERQRHAVGVGGAELAVLVDEAHDGGGERDRDRGGGDEQKEDLAHSGGHRAPQPGEVPPGGEAAQGGEQHRGQRDAEHPLGQHVDAEGGVDGARRLLGDQRAKRRVDHQVEVDDAQADRHRQHEHEHLAHARVSRRPVHVQPEAQAREHGTAIASWTAVPTSTPIA